MQAKEKRQKLVSDDLEKRVSQADSAPSSASKGKRLFGITSRNEHGREGYRRPTAHEYSMMRMAGVAKVEMLIDFLRDIDAKLDDTSRQFDRYQRRTHGAITISFRQIAPFLYPYFALFHFQAATRRFQASAITDEQVAAWNLERWSKKNINPGVPFKKTLHGAHRLIQVRRQVMAALNGNPINMNMKSLESSVVAANKKLDRLLDELVRSMVYDWESQNAIKPQGDDGY